MSLEELYEFLKHSGFIKITSENTISKDFYSVMVSTGKERWVYMFEDGSYITLDFTPENIQDKFYNYIKYVPKNEDDIYGEIKRHDFAITDAAREQGSKNSIGYYNGLYDDILRYLND